MLHVPYVCMSFCKSYGTYSYRLLSLITFLLLTTSKKYTYIHLHTNAWLSIRMELSNACYHLHVHRNTSKVWRNLTIHSFRGNERMLDFFFIRHEIEFWWKVGSSFCNTNIWIYQISKPCKQFKKLLNNTNIDPMFSQ